MGLMDHLKKGFDMAKEGATDLAQTAKLRMEIGKLADRRAELCQRIGEQVYASASSGEAQVGFVAEVEEIRSLEAEVAAKNVEIERIRTEEGPPVRPLA